MPLLPRTMPFFPRSTAAKSSRLLASLPIVAGTVFGQFSVALSLRPSRLGA